MNAITCALRPIALAVSALAVSAPCAMLAFAQAQPPMPSPMDSSGRPMELKIEPERMLIVDMPPNNVIAPRPSPSPTSGNPLQLDSPNVMPQPNPGLGPGTGTGAPIPAGPGVVPRPGPGAGTGTGLNSDDAKCADFARRFFHLPANMKKLLVGALVKCIEKSAAAGP